MITLIFLVCNTTTGFCYSATSGTIHETQEACVAEAEAITKRQYALQEEGKAPPELAAYKCVDWGNPT